MTRSLTNRINRLESLRGSNDPEGKQAAQNHSDILAEFVEQVFANSNDPNDSNACHVARLLLGLPNGGWFRRALKGESTEVLAQIAYGESWQEKQAETLHIASQEAVKVHGKNWYDKLMKSLQKARETDNEKS